MVRFYDLAEEIVRQADASGRVRLLLQEGRSRQLRSLQVQLDDRQGGLTGTLVVRGRGGVPANSIVTVELENESRPHFVVRNGRQTYRMPAYTEREIPFALNYDPRYISESDRYVVRASVSSNGRVTHTTVQTPYVLTQGYPNNVQLTLTPTSYTAGGGSGNIIEAGYPSYDRISQRVSEAYQRYLGRRPTSVELAVWQRVTDIQYRMDELPIELMGSQEYFDRVGNNNEAWMQRVFFEMLGRAPSRGEMDQWMRRLAELRYSRTELLRQLKLVSAG